MKKIFILLLIIPILGFSQNDLVFDRVLNFRLTPGQEATVPSGKAWKIERGASNATFSLKSTNQPYGDNLNYENTGTQFGDVTSTPTWLGAGASIKGISSSGWLSILEFNVVAASSGSGGVDTGGNTNNSDGFSNNSTDTSPGDDFTDADGNNYSTSVTNGIVWTTSNANHSTYRDGTPIPHITDFTEWHASTIGAYTYFIQDETLGYGKIYNMHAINGKHDDDINTANKKFAPEGWRVPARQDWINLAAAFIIEGVTPSNGVIASTAFALKSDTGWSVNGTNESGLNLKPSGYIYGYSSQGDAYGFNTNTQSPSTGTNTDDYMTKYWTSDLYSNNSGSLAWNISIYNADYYSIWCVQTDGTINSSGNGSNAGNYVRLIRDAN